MTFSAIDPNTSGCQPDRPCVEIAPRYVVRDFDTGTCLQSFGGENCSCLRQTLLGTRFLLLLKLHLGSSIFRREGRENWNDIHKEEFGMEVQSEVGRRL
jgi:hypothetical protein